MTFSKADFKLYSTVDKCSKVCLKLSIQIKIQVDQVNYLIFDILGCYILKNVIQSLLLPQDKPWNRSVPMLSLPPAPFT